MTPTASVIAFTRHGGRQSRHNGRLFCCPRQGASMTYLIVFLGGGIGAALRHGFNIGFARALGTAFPYATLFENVSGSLAMGLLIGWFALKSGMGAGLPQHWQLFLTTGIL